jgi:hypothetical protein
LRKRKGRSTILLHADSHVDHGLTEAQIKWLLTLGSGHSGGLLISTVEMPAEVGTVPCSLYGPLAGDEAVPESEVVRQRRGSREWESRIVRRPVRQTRTVTVVAGPHDGNPLVLFTAYGGPQAPQEPGDPACRDRAASEAFWAEHALAL